MEDERVKCAPLPPQLLSFLAFILEEMVNSCITCSVLYFFEFVSCTAFLFTLLLLVLLATKLHTKVGINCWAKLVRSCCRCTSHNTDLLLAPATQTAAGVGGKTLGFGSARFSGVWDCLGRFGTAGVVFGKVWDCFGGV